MKPYLVLFTIAGLLVWNGCTTVSVYPPESDAGAAANVANDSSKTDDEKPFDPWDQVLKNSRQMEGYFTFHLKRDRTLLVELRPDQLGEEFGMVLHFSRGVGEFNLHDGLYLSRTRLMRFRRIGDKVQLVHHNHRFTAEANSPMRRSLDENIGHSIIGTFDIKSRHEKNNHLLVDVTSFFVSDYPDLARQINTYYESKPVSFDKDKSYVEQVMGFPKNVEIDAALTYKSGEHPRSGTEAVSDYRSIPVGVRYSLFALPGDPMQPRLADDRLGHFVDAIKDFSRDQHVDPYVTYVNRWRLEKKNPSAAVSEPVQPIVFYIDRSVPEPYRKYVAEGIEAWNKAFEQAGFENALAARQAPANDTTWSAEDIRYSTVRWTAAHEMGYAIGPSQTDPRTGEILNADILISSVFTRYLLTQYQELADPEALLQHRRRAMELLQTLPPERAEKLCMVEFGKMQQLQVQYAVLVGMGVLEGGQPMPETFLGDAIRDLVMHEIGHTLGLRHNFKASSGIPSEQLQDTSFTSEHGVSLSVMDYAPVNIAPEPDEQGHYWNKVVGTYDDWVIRYAYTPIYEQSADGPLETSGELVDSPEEERVGLNKIARQATDSLHTYATDEDTRLGPYAVDPLANLWELGSDPLEYARGRANLVRTVQPSLEERLIDVNEGYHRLRMAMNSMIYERLVSLLPVTKMVGGLYFVRDHKGDPDQRPPFRVVSSVRQRDAVDLLIREAFAADAFQFQPDQLNKLAPNREAHWGTSWFTTPLDYPVHDYVELVHRVLLDELLHPARLQRMQDNEARVPGNEMAYTIGELFQTLTGAVWQELDEIPAGGTISSFRRNLQRLYTDQLIRLLLNEPSDRGSGLYDDQAEAPEHARSLARLELTELSVRIGEVLEEDDALDRDIHAHLAESKARIDRGLSVSLSRAVE